MILSFFFKFQSQNYTVTSVLVSTKSKILIMIMQVYFHVCTEILLTSDSAHNPEFWNT
jgi:hypothetical protein